MSSALSKEFTAQAVRHLQVDFLPKIRSCLAQLTEEEIWWRPNPNSNSVGNLLLHLCGNVRQWIIAAVGGERDARNRDLEFETRERVAADRLIGRLEATVERAAGVIESLDAENLLQKHRIQIYEVSALQAVFHVVEHFSYHTGQIAYVTKMLKDLDLDFYADLKRQQGRFESQDSRESTRQKWP